MSFTRLLTAALLLVAVAFPASAAAAPKAKNPVTQAASIAARYWGAVPCQGQIKVVARQPVPAGLAADSGAWVTFGSSLGANNLEAPASTYTGCTIALGRDRWPTTASMNEDWDLLCMTMVHEYGHLLGHAHDATHGSVMVPVFIDYASEPRLCRRSRPRSR